MVSSFSEKKDVGIPVDNMLKRSQPCPFATRQAKHIMVCIRQSVASGFRAVMLPFCLALVGPHLQSSILIDCVSARWQMCFKVIKKSKNDQSYACAILTSVTAHIAQDPAVIIDSSLKSFSHFVKQLKNVNKELSIIRKDTGKTIQQAPSKSSVHSSLQHCI